MRNETSRTFWIEIGVLQRVQIERVQQLRLVNVAQRKQFEAHTEAGREMWHGLQHSGQCVHTLQFAIGIGHQTPFTFVLRFGGRILENDFLIVHGETCNSNVIALYIFKEWSICWLSALSFTCGHSEQQTNCQKSPHIYYFLCNLPLRSLALNKNCPVDWKTIELNDLLQRSHAILYQASIAYRLRIVMVGLEFLFDFFLSV